MSSIFKREAQSNFSKKETELEQKLDSKPDEITTWMGSTHVDCNASVNEYISGSDWRIKANANTGYSNSGLINNVAGKVIANFWLDEIYSPEEGGAHRSGDIHIHDLDCLTGYCAGWSLRALLNEGFNGVDGRVSSRPPKHFREALGQMSNFLGILQSEWAGAQAFSSFDTYLAPYVFRDDLSPREIKKAIRQFVYNLNVPARWGQSPFTNITLDITVPEDLQNQVPTYDDHHLFKDIDDRDLLKKAQERDSAIQTLEELTYTNSSQVPADHTDDPFEALDLQNNLQCKYTGGTVMHLYMGEKLPSAESCKRFVKKVIENYQMPYITVTPVFSICETHGYLNGEQPECPTCGEATNVWTRVMGYFRPVSSFNKGKKGEHLERQHFLDHHLESGGRIEDA